jgi:hypothetical protein
LYHAYLRVLEKALAKIVAAKENSNRTQAVPESVAQWEIRVNMIVFALLAALGLLISIAANVSTFFGVEPMHRWAYLWLLQLGIFVVFIPAAATQSPPGNQRSFRWRDVFGDAPAWMRWMLVGLIVYAPVSALAFVMVCGSGGPSQEPNGTYAMTSHGRILRTLTAVEYHRASGYEFRFMSSWWIMFYSLSLALLVSARNRQKALARPPEATVQCGLNRRRLMPIWLHQTITLFFLVFGWVGVPALTAIYILHPFRDFLGPFNILIIVAAWIFGVFVPAGIMRRSVAASCPECGGRVRCESVMNWIYRCTECGHFEKRTK